MRRQWATVVFMALVAGGAWAHAAAASQRLTLQSQAALTRIEIHGGAMSVQAPGYRSEYTVEVRSARGLDAAVVLRNGRSVVHAALRFEAGGRFTIGAVDGPLAGTATLMR